MTRRLSTKVIPLLIALAVVLAACGSDAKSSSSKSTSSSAPATTTIKFALDWTPNTNHTGLYVAKKLGYFTKAGLDVQILPYNSTSPDTLVGAGSADFGISFQDSTTFSKAAGLPITSVMAVLQHTGTEIAVKKDSNITRPKQLDGKTYGGFGAPSEVPTLQKVIQNDGGTGQFKTIILNTSAYEALYAGQVDFTIPFIAWEAIEAVHKKEPLKVFQYTDYGFPDQYAVIVIGNSPWLKAHPAAAKAFVEALQQGYQYSVDHPKEAAQDLIDENPTAFDDKPLVFESQALLAKSFLKDASGKVGFQTLAQWTKYSDFLYKSDLLKDGAGKKLTKAPDYSTFFTNQYLAP
jgi:ABC-type nitrate/sulfonate/bicarbonate transport system substrate-binding protein